MRQTFFIVCLVVLCLFFATLTFAQSEKLTEGSLRVFNKEGKDGGLCPLKNTDVKAEISGFISRVTVTQTFQNPFNEAIEAVYMFPLPNDSAVDDMTIQIGERKIKAKIMEKEKAQEVYEKAKGEGKVAALLEQQRPNIFTQAVANILPNAEIKVIISYVENLRYSDGNYEFSFPMTVGERYVPVSTEENPESSSKTGVPDARKISAPARTRPPHTVSLEVKLDAGVPLESFEVNTHEVVTQQPLVNVLNIKLKDENEIPNRDFVLKYKTAGGNIKDAVLTHRDGKDGYFSLILQPPAKVLPTEITPKEIVFVLDTSGSMNGMPIEKAKEAMKLTLDGINPNDTFNLITFAGDTRILFDKPVPATKENLEKAQKFLSESKSSGGTEMMKAIKAALEPSDSQNHLRIVCFMTDGYVGNEAEILAEIQKHPNARVFGFGIGSSINRYLLDEMSREGRGDVEYVNLGDDGSKVARRFYERIRNPLLTDILVEIQGVQTAEIFPRRIPDLFDSRPVILVGKYLSGGDAKVVLRGRVNGKEFLREIPIKFPNRNKENDVLATLWARKKVADLTRRDFLGVQTGEMKTELKQAITNLGLEYRLLTQFTSFVAVEEKVVNEDGEIKTVEVPIATPFGQVNRRNEYNFSLLTANVVSSTSSSIGTITTHSPYPKIAKGKSGEYVSSLIGGTVNVSENSNYDKSGLVSSNGQKSTANLFRVEDINVNFGISSDETSISRNGGSLPVLTASGSTTAFIAEDATDEITLVTFNGAAKEQQTGGINTKFSSRSGTNEFRGSIFEHFGNDKLNANDSFAKARNLPRAESNLNQFGGTFGGYFVKDRAFFFTNYEGLRLKQPAFAVSEVPSIISRQTASNEMIPFLNSFATPNGKATENGLAEFASTFNNPALHNNFGLKLDTQITDDLRIGGRYSFTNSDATTRGSEGFSLNTLRRQDANTILLSGNLTYIITPNVVASGLISFAQNKLSQRFSLDNFGGANIAQNLFTNSFTKYDFLGKNSALAVGEEISTKVNQFETFGNLKVIKGNHDFSFTGNFRRLSFDLGANPNERNITFAGVANSLNGNAVRINEIFRSTAPQVNLHNLSFTAEDKYRMMKDTTLNFGIRWDINSAPQNLWKTQYSNFAPRVSIAQKLFNEKTIIRAGIGLFYDFGNSIATDYFVNSSPYLAGNSAQNINFTNLATNPFSPTTIFANNLQNPRTWQFNIGFEQEVTNDLKILTNYLKTLGRKLYLTETQNSLNRFISNDGKSDYQALQIELNQRFRYGFFAMVNYTLSKSEDNFSVDSNRRAIIQQGWGTSDFDARHNFKGLISYTPPVNFDNKTLQMLSKNWTPSVLYTYRTALPINVMYAKVNDFGLEYYRPDLSGNSIYLANREINQAAFSIPIQTAVGDLPRNYLRGNSLFQLDFDLSRRIEITSDINLHLSATFSNLLNKTNLADPNSIIGTQTGNLFTPNSTFGRNLETFGSNSFTPFYYAGGARTIQFSAKLSF